MFLVRLGPLIPYNVLNYLVGATTVTIKDNAIGYLGYIPCLVFETYLGAQIKHMEDIFSSTD